MNAEYTTYKLLNSSLGIGAGAGSSILGSSHALLSLMSEQESLPAVMACRQAGLLDR